MVYFLVSDSDQPALMYEAAMDLGWSTWNGFCINPLMISVQKIDDFRR